MVKLPKRFSVGERVFAKVRGYPPWPAKIESVTDPNTKNAKYHVVFYGTQEIGTCKVDDIFQYADNKDKFSKTVRRKYFQEGLQQLEEDLKKNPSNDSSLASETAENVPENITSDNSEKESGSVSAGDVDNLVIDERDKKKALKRKSQNVPNTPDVTEVKKKRGRKSLAASAVENTPKQDSALESQDEDGEKKVVSRSGRKIKPKRFHDSIDAEISIDSSRNDHSIRYKKNKTDDENQDTPVAPIKKRINDDKDKKVKDEVDLQNQMRLNALRLEEQFAFFDAQIRSSLGLEQANTEDCLEAMDKLIEFPFTALMLKKHPYTVETIKRLRRYVGNLNDWKLTEEETIAFKEKADLIKKKAELIYDRFRSLFNIPEGQTFWAYFTEQLALWKEYTKDLSQEEYYSIVSEPTEPLKSEAKQTVAETEVTSPVASKSDVPENSEEASAEDETAAATTATAEFETEADTAAADTSEPSTS